MIRVAIADDQEMIRAGFGMIIGNEPDMSVVASAQNGREIVNACASQDIDVVLMDIRMPELDGLAATEQIMAAEDPPRIVILTTFGLDEYVSTAIAAGAVGFLLKDGTAEDLVKAIRSVAAGEGVIAPRLIRTVFAQARSTPRPATVPGFDDLTDREREVLQLLATGYSNAEIGRKIHLSEATVKTHIGRILLKLNVRDRVQAVIAAFRSGFVSL